MEADVNGMAVTAKEKRSVSLGLTVEMLSYRWCSEQVRFRGEASAVNIETSAFLSNSVEALKSVLSTGVRTYVPPFDYSDSEIPCCTVRNTNARPANTA